MPDTAERNRLNAPEVPRYGTCRVVTAGKTATFKSLTSKIHMARPAGSPNKDKPFRDALRMELAAAGEDQKALRVIARNLIALASKEDKDAMPAIKEIADRVDGKVAQGVMNDEEGGPLQMVISWQSRQS